MRIEPDVLSKAGFYYYGMKDMVKCFYCNGGLRDWCDTDEPFAEHARWFPHCSFIKQLMGQDYMIEQKFRNSKSEFKTDKLDTELNIDLNAYVDLRVIRKLIARCGFDLETVKKLLNSKNAGRFNTDEFFREYFKLSRKTESAVDKVVHLKLMNVDANFCKIHLVELLFAEHFFVKVKFIE